MATLMVRGRECKGLLKAQHPLVKDGQRRACQPSPADSPAAAVAAVAVADPRITDYDTLLRNILDLKEGRPTEVRRGLPAGCSSRRLWETRIGVLKSGPAAEALAEPPKPCAEARPATPAYARCSCAALPLPAGAHIRLQGEPAHGDAQGGRPRVAGGHPGGHLRTQPAHQVRWSLAPPGRLLGLLGVEL